MIMAVQPESQTSIPSSQNVEQGTQCGVQGLFRLLSSWAPSGEKGGLEEQREEEQRWELALALKVPPSLHCPIFLEASSSKIPPEPPIGEHRHPSPHSVLRNGGPKFASHAHVGTVTRT